MEVFMSCALCKKDTELRKSHLIPKFVYKRIRLHPKSRFRSIDNIKVPMQDGEKYTMLCHECEERFSALETFFSKHYFDPYLSTGKVAKIKDKNMINDYILSVAWRILWNDLFCQNSFEDKEYIKNEFQTFESDLRHYLLGDKKDYLNRFENSVYTLDSLIKCPKSIAEGTLFGYSYYPNHYIGCLVIVYYAGLVFVTRYTPSKSIVMCLGYKAKTNLKEIVAEEISRQFNYIRKQENEVMTPELKRKIAERYKE